MNDQPEEISTPTSITVEVEGSLLSDREVVMMPDPRTMPSHAAMAVAHAEERSKRRFEEYCRENGYAVRDVRVEWRFTITGTGFKKPEGPEFEEVSAEQWRDLVQTSAPLPMPGTILVDLMLAGPSREEDDDEQN